MNKRVKAWVEGLIGREIEQFGRRSFALIDKQQPTEAWFSYRAQIRALLSSARVDLVLDVGANEGQFAQRLRSHYQGEIVSFEPVSQAFGKLRTAAAADRAWHVQNVALGSVDSRRAMHVPNATVFSSFLRTNEYCARRFGDVAVATTEELVSIRRADGLLQEIVPDIANRRVFLKMDTQGYDMEVFNGLGHALSSVVAIQSELSVISIYDRLTHWTDSLAAYERAGFGVVGMFPVNRDSSRVVEYDCLLLRCN